jgi:energy-coupling factor transporter transmembrane protein EcfT
MDRSFQLGGEVYSAMLARGFTGEVRTLSRFRLRRADGLIVIGSVLVAAIALTAARLLP